ncbi:MAG: DUF3703 domain-containing protein [Piscinibacter sp.]|uniref:DUF3703 domain-containing protein n=1 Tax=Piscinibacter sp. TaxID=1903157 RepID=UPI0025899FA0|nr:DUF3703 domain-containing protein [Piscinibacter sp.]MCW5663706.1 DUF3703 domain-containing protein [Piscinibacter sp.]
MPSFNQTIRPCISAELTEAWCALRRGERESSFRHLERAHVLGQSSTLHHVRVHLSMLAWALHTRTPREVAGQLLRIVGATTKTPFGLVPTGNSGGSNVSPAKPLPIPADLAASIASARQNAQPKA